MEVLTHRQIWLAIDSLAENLGMSPSGLARKSGLDSTSFNPSKRFTASGRERWPSTESIAKILRATDTSIDEFMGHIERNRSDPGAQDRFSYRNLAKKAGIPLIGFAQAGNGGFFDDAGFPAGHGWDVIELPGAHPSDSSYALRISGDSMLPLYREGDVLIVDPSVVARTGDRVVAKTREGEVFAKIMTRNTASRIELASLNPEHPDLAFAPEELEWVARIVWASQ